MNLSRRDARLSRVGLGQERIELLAGAFHRVRQRVCVARESDRGGARLVVRRRVAHQHRCDLGLTPAASSHVAAVWRHS
jgi:hypothetical protein